MPQAEHTQTHPLAISVHIYSSGWTCSTENAVFSTCGVIVYVHSVLAALLLRVLILPACVLILPACVLIFCVF